MRKSSWFATRQTIDFSYKRAGFSVNVSVFFKKHLTLRQFLFVYQIKIKLQLLSNTGPQDLNLRRGLSLQVSLEVLQFYKTFCGKLHLTCNRLNKSITLSSLLNFAIKNTISSSVIVKIHYRQLLSYGRVGYEIVTFQ